LSVWAEVEKAKNNTMIEQRMSDRFFISLG